jgi:hypothetical protein
MLNVRIPAAKFIDEKIPHGEAIGATDLGVVRYYAHQPIIDLFGHVNQNVFAFRESGGTWADYISKEGLCYLMLFDSVENNGMDFAKEMKLKNDPRFDLEKIATFSISPEDWYFGNGPHQNYMPAVSIYNIDWHDNAVCQR